MCNSNTTSMNNVNVLNTYALSYNSYGNIALDYVGSRLEVKTNDACNCHFMF